MKAQVISAAGETGDVISDRVVSYETDISEGGDILPFGK